MGFLDSGAGDGYDMLTPEQQAIIDAEPVEHDDLAELLEAHHHQYDYNDWQLSYGCAAGDWEPENTSWREEHHREHAAHLAGVLLRHGVSLRAGGRDLSEAQDHTRAHGYGKRPAYTRQELIELWERSTGIRWVYYDALVLRDFTRALDVEVVEHSSAVSTYPATERSSDGEVTE